jgi:hypothetical protein
MMTPSRGASRRLGIWQQARRSRHS